MFGPLRRTDAGLGMSLAPELVGLPARAPFLLVPVRLGLAVAGVKRH